MSAPANARRELWLTALLAAAGAGIAVVGGGRGWASVRAADAVASVTPSLTIVTGGRLAGAAGALGWAGLAGLAALFATRGRFRSALGAVFILLGAGIAYASATATGRSRILDAAYEQSAILRMAGRLTVHPTAWWAVSLTGGIMLAGAGLITLLRGARWPGLSARYDPAGVTRAPGVAGEVPVDVRDDPSGIWKSIDRGEDPTVIEHKEH